MESKGDEDKPLKIYKGKTAVDNLEIRVFNDGYVFGRSFGKSKKYEYKININWKFDNDGKIVYINRYSFDNKQKETFFHRLKNKLEGYVLCCHLTSDVSSIEEDFESLDMKSKYLKILKLGYSIANDLLISIEENKIQDSYNIENDQISLKEIKKDDNILAIIKKTALLIPSLKVEHIYRDTIIFHIIYESLNSSLR